MKKGNLQRILWGLHTIQTIQYSRRAAAVECNIFMISQKWFFFVIEFRNRVLKILKKRKIQSIYENSIIRIKTAPTHKSHKMLTWVVPVHDIWTKCRSKSVGSDG